jgi:hypothetical protein
MLDAKAKHAFQRHATPSISIDSRRSSISKCIGSSRYFRQGSSIEHYNDLASIIIKYLGLKREGRERISKRMSCCNEEKEQISRGSFLS